MKAMIWTNYGPSDVFQLKEVEKPTPKDNEVLIKVHAATVTTGDCELRSLQLFSLFDFHCKSMWVSGNQKELPFWGKS